VERHLDRRQLQRRPPRRRRERRRERRRRAARAASGAEAHERETASLEQRASVHGDAGMLYQAVPPMAQAIALVTGTPSGIGAATARALVERGWTVVGVSRRPAAIDRANYTHVEIDLADLRALPAAFDAAVAPHLTARHWQRIGLVNNAAQ